MNRLVSISVAALLLVLTAGTVWADGPTPNGTDTKSDPATKLEAFLSQRGVMLVKEYQDIGKIESKKRGLLKISQSAMLVSVLAVYQPGKQEEALKGFRFSIVGKRDGTDLVDANTSFLDIEEVDSLSKAVDYLAGLAEKWKDQKNKEVVFATKDDFRIGFYLDRDKGLVAIASSGRIGRITHEFASPTDFAALKELVDKGLGWLKER